ncbi:thioredoxin domain [Listeria phage vB_LmoM_AG20]|uniref:Thioredoxin n=1 Tax=Listeria phage vB_LmoM_AG20 TaxID=1168744 RepID=M4H0F1_9CAUD|nr:thioredoxin domain [Listeria phage vB_LmoM_AG20]AFJ76058.1 hypothetical protein AG2_122 [Listeria phage vB_LmoM_AG20]
MTSKSLLNKRGLGFSFFVDIYKFIWYSNSNRGEVKKMTKKNIKITSKTEVKNSSIEAGDIFYIEGVSKGLTNLSGLYIVTFDFHATEESLSRYALVSLETGMLNTISINQFSLEEKIGCIVKVNNIEIVANTKEV